MNRRFVLLLIAAVGAMAVNANVHAVGTTYTVNSDLDNGDGNCHPAPGVCTLRDALQAATGDLVGVDTIRFDSSVFPPGGGITIAPLTSLPDIITHDGLTIDGQGADVSISGTALPPPSQGLVLYTPPGTTMHDVTVKNLTVEYFTYEGLVICAGDAEGNCTYDASNIDVENVVAMNNGRDGISVGGAKLTNVTVDGVDSHDNHGNGVELRALSASSGLAVSNSQTANNYNAGIAIFGALHDVMSQPVIENNSVASSGNAGILVSGLPNNGRVSGNTVAQSLADGVFISGVESLSGFEITDNHVDASGYWGIFVQTIGATSGFLIDNNVVTNSTYSGIAVESQAGSGDVIEHNVVHGGAEDGVYIGSAARVKITQNSIYSNVQLGIDLYTPDDSAPGVTPNDAGDGDSGPNGLLNFPLIAGGTAEAITGTACGHCTVELFLADPDPTGYGEGKTFLADGKAEGGGAFSVSICGLGLEAGKVVTSTATDSAGDTSEFSLNFTLTEPSGDCPSLTPTPSPTPTAGPQHKQGDLNCNGTIDGRDALRPIRAESGLAMTQPGGCPQLTDGSPQFGDVNCDGSIDAGDSVAILEFAGGVAIKPTPAAGCVPIGEVLS